MARKHRDASPEAEGGKGIHVPIRWPPGTQVEREATVVAADDIPGFFYQPADKTLWFAHTVGAGADKWAQVNGGGAGTTDHGALTGLADDDHPQYTRADGSRPFTAPISGVAPASAAHLATKGYTDAAASAAASAAQAAAQAYADGLDADALHKDVDGEIQGLPIKDDPVDGDALLGENSEDYGAKVQIPVNALLGLLFQGTKRKEFRSGVVAAGLSDIEGQRFTIPAGTNLRIIVAGFVSSSTADASDCGVRFFLGHCQRDTGGNLSLTGDANLQTAFNHGVSVVEPDDIAVDGDDIVLRYKTVLALQNSSFWAVAVCSVQQSLTQIDPL